MVVIRVVLMAAVLAWLGVTCFADGLDWTARDRYGLQDDQEHSSLTNTSILRDLRLGPDSGVFRLDYLSEVHRLLKTDSGRVTLDSKSLLKKSLLALPFLKTYNASELVMRPEQNLVITLGRRAVLRKYKKRTQVQPPSGMIAVDTHTHTSASSDSLASVSQMLISAASHGLNGIAITDHDTFDAARRAVDTAKELVLQGKLPAEFFVIPGEEISSSDGHIIGLYLSSEIPGGKSAEWTVQAIHDQGGLAIAAHPMLPNGLHNLANTLPFDAVETESASEKLHYAITPNQDNARREAFYRTVTKPRIGASDSHDPESVGECYTLAVCAATPEAFREAILKGDTTAVATVSDKEERSATRRPFLRAISAFWLLNDLSPMFGKLNHTQGLSLSILPRPVFRFYRKF